MSEEFIGSEPITEAAEETFDGVTEGGLPEERPSLLPGFKDICFRLGLMMIVVFAARGALSVVSSLMFTQEEIDAMTPFTQTLVNGAFSIVFLYLIPIVSAVFILKRPLKNSPNKIYAKPKYMGRAMGMFPAGYGLAMAVRLISVWIGSLFARGTGIGDSFHATEGMFEATDIATALLTFVQLAVIAPIFEEFWFRGIVMESLRTYRNGFAIFISAILFGLTHSNLEQFFYATALGIFLGYIAVSTRSIITTTIMHAMFNSISGVMILLAADKSVGDYLLSKGETEVEMTPGIAMYMAWMGLVLLLMAVGIIMLIYKLIKIKKYHVPKMQTEISSARRWAIFLTRATVIIMVVMAADSFIYRLIPTTVYYLIKDTSVIPAYYQYVFGDKS